MRCHVLLRRQYGPAWARTVLIVNVFELSSMHSSRGRRSSGCSGSSGFILILAVAVAAGNGKLVLRMSSLSN